MTTRDAGAHAPVTPVDDRLAPYLADQAAFAASRPSDESPALAALRARAIARLGEIGLPSVQSEDWRFTDIAALTRSVFRRHADGGPTVTPDAVARVALQGAHNLVFVNGRFAPALSARAALPPGVVAGSLREALGDGRLLDGALGRHVSYERQPFVALNTAFIDDGAVVSVPRGVVMEVPLHLVFVTTPAATPRACYPRNVIAIGDGASATIVETYVGEGHYFTCGVTEVLAGAASVVDHYKVQHEAREACHLATLQVAQDRDSAFTTHSISTGGGLVRYDVNAFLDGEGVECTLNGLYVADGAQLVDHHMWVEHMRPHGSSRELFKGILAGSARAVFNGRIRVRREAQQTDAKQANRNLLLSDQALVHSNPQLEIFADDVKCTHGSTVGQLDADALFYLRSRGIDDAAARSLLVYAFGAEVISGIKVPEVRANLENHLYDRLPEGDLVRQAR